MKKKLILEKDIIKLSKDVVTSFYNRDIEHSIHYLADEFLWIGAFDFQYTRNKEEFINVIQSELHSLPFYMLDEEFFLLSKSPSTYIVCSKFILTAKTTTNDIIRTHTRLTIIWKYIGDELKLFHIHGSNSQDIPLFLSMEHETFSQNKDFFSYITATTPPNNNKISFKDKTGAYRYFFDYEIIYLEANGKSTLLYTREKIIELSGLLSENASTLSAHFYRIHKSYVINTAFINSLERYKVTLINKVELPVSKEKFIPLRKFKGQDWNKINNNY